MIYEIKFYFLEQTILGHELNYLGDWWYIVVYCIFFWNHHENLKLKKDGDLFI